MGIIENSKKVSLITIDMFDIIFVNKEKEKIVLYIH